MDVGEIVSKSIHQYLDAFSSSRIPPLDGAAGQPVPKSTALNLSQLAVVLVLCVIARSVLAGGDLVQLSVMALTAAIALIALLGVGLLVNTLWSEGEAPERTQRGSVFIMVYLTLSLILYILIDVTTQLAGDQAFTASLFVPLAGTYGFDEVWTGILTALFFSLLAWVLLMVKSGFNSPSFSLRRALLTIQFPFFVALNTVFLYVLVLMPL